MIVSSRRRDILELELVDRAHNPLLDPLSLASIYSTPSPISASRQFG